MLNRRQFLSATPAALAALAYSPSFVIGAADPTDVPAAAQPPKIGFSSRTADLASIKPGHVTTASPKVCKILQFTDLHFFNKTAVEDEMTISDFRRHLDRHRPDLVVVSGDLWHDNPEGRGQRGSDLAIKTFSSWDVPWTMCWGNHDLLSDYQQGHDLFERAPHSVYRGGASHGDHRIEVRPAGADPKDGPVLDLYFLNSSDEGLTAWQVGAFREMARQVASARPKPVPALAFFHIPILEYETRINPATIKGVKMEGVGRGKENGLAFPALTAPQSIRACFCGHNHTNDYAVKADSMDLIYGRSSGYAGYGGETLRKGAKLIEIDLSNGNYYPTSVFADGTKHIA